MSTQTISAAAEEEADRMDMNEVVIEGIVLRFTKRLSNRTNTPCFDMIVRNEVEAVNSQGKKWVRFGHFTCLTRGDFAAELHKLNFAKAVRAEDGLYENGTEVLVKGMLVRERPTPATERYYIDIQHLEILNSPEMEEDDPVVVVTHPSLAQANKSTKERVKV